MAIETKTGQTELDWAEDPVTAALPGHRRGRLTLAERRTLLLLVDLVLINASLILALAVWEGVRVTPAVLLDSSKWYVTLSIIWLIPRELVGCSLRRGGRSRGTAGGPSSRDPSLGSRRPPRLGDVVRWQVSDS